MFYNSRAGKRGCVNATQLVEVCVHVCLSGAPFSNQPPTPPPHTYTLFNTHPRTQAHTGLLQKPGPQTGGADQSITSLLQQSNKVIIRQQLTDLERPGQSKAAVMWGLALAHVTVTQSGRSCCQRKERWKEERHEMEAEFKEKKHKELQETIKEFL